MPTDMPWGAQVNISFVFLFIVWLRAVTWLIFLSNLQSHHSLWDGKCSCCDENTVLCFVAATFQRPMRSHSATCKCICATTPQQCISSTNDNGSTLLSCNCGCVFSCLVSKDYVCETQGPANCFECLSTLYDCTVLQVFNKAAPLECSKRVSIVA